MTDELVKEALLVRPAPIRKLLNMLKISITPNSLPTFALDRCFTVQILTILRFFGNPQEPCRLELYLQLYKRYSSFPNFIPWYLLKFTKIYTFTILNKFFADFALLITLVTLLTFWATMGSRGTEFLLLDLGFMIDSIIMPVFCNSDIFHARTSQRETVAPIYIKPVDIWARRKFVPLLVRNQSAIGSVNVLGMTTET
ncbi:uncharacterized protein EAF01_004128 [Botrytis porri]|uniref:uncharacterized protein n=1 Tax=Botrytis porri TaxID=87229 RepID=UPI0019005602|nr:uncharacterized protein EAF01_004128 [Botrytis porri]KAF7908373.1 hypothetical protein EAF01_004128 [Botrytis porri]